MSQKVSSIYAELGIQDKATEVLEGFKRSMLETGNVAGITLAAVATLGIGIEQALSAAAEKQVAYADEVRAVQQQTGLTADASSRLIQVLDDLKVSTNDMAAAQKTLTKNGYTLTIETLGVLSDKYLSLNSQQEKNDFAVKNLGKNWKAWIEVLQQGSDKLNRMNDSVDKNLILMQDSVDAAREYQKLLDEQQDTWNGLTYVVGGKWLPIQTRLTAMSQTYVETLIKHQYSLKDLIPGYLMWSTALEFVSERIKVGNEEMSDAAQHAWALRAAQGAMTQSTDETTISLQEQQDALEEADKKLQTYNKNFIDGVLSLTDANKDFNESQQEIKDKQAEIIAEKEKAFPWEHDKIQDLQDQYDDLSKKYEQNAKDHEERTQKILLDMTLEAIAMSDGVAGFSAAEAEKALAVAKTAGAAEESAIRQQIAMQQIADAMANPRQQAFDINQALRDMTAHGWTVQIAIQAQNLDALYSAQAAVGGGKVTYGNSAKRASGGPAKGMTWVGENGPELLDLPAGSYVHSNKESGNMMNGGGATMVFNVMVNSNGDPEDAARRLTPAVKRILRAEGLVS